MSVSETFLQNALDVCWLHTLESSKLPKANGGIARHGVAQDRHSREVQLQFHVNGTTLGTYICCHFFYLTAWQWSNFFPLHAFSSPLHVANSSFFLLAVVSLRNSMEFLFPQVRGCGCGLSSVCCQAGRAPSLRGKSSGHSWVAIWHCQWPECTG